MSTAYHMLCAVYGNHLHFKNGTHLSVANNTLLQRHWGLIIKLPMGYCDMLLDRVGIRFVNQLMVG